MEGNVNPGAEGFLNIFRAEGAEGAAADDTHTDDQDSRTAESSSPQTEESLSADEVVAQRFAASLEADGIEWPDEDEEEDEGSTKELSLDDLTPEQMRALAEEAIDLRARVSQADRDFVAGKLQAATQSAITEVQGQYQRDVLNVAAKHYAGYFAQQQAKIIRAAQETQNPEQYIVRHSATLFNTVLEARQKWESEQTETYDERMKEAIKTARKNVPELRQLYAADLAVEFGLPEAAIKEIAKTRSIDDFRARAEELAGLRQLLAQRDKEQAQQRRVDANKRLKEHPVRTTPNGRAPGGKVPEYKGTPEEGVRIMSLFHN